jgi:transcriptional regulator with XRE-family HTH domain
MEMYASMSMQQNLAPKCAPRKHNSARRFVDAVRMEADIRKLLAINVKALREHAGMSQTALGKKADIAQTAVSYCEQPDGKSPSLETLAKLAKALRVPSWWLLLDHGIPEAAQAQALGEIVSLCARLPPDGSAQVLRVAEAEARYHRVKN